MHAFDQTTLYACTLIDRPTAPPLPIAVTFEARVDPAGVPSGIYRYHCAAGVSSAHRPDRMVPLHLHFPHAARPLTAEKVFEAIRAAYFSNDLLRSSLEQWEDAA